jgi:hypothetical protein
VVRICSCTKAPAAEVDVEAEAEEVVDEQIHSTGEGSGNNEEELSALFYSLHDSLHIPRADELQRLVELREETRCSGAKARRATELMAQSDGGEEVAAEEEEAETSPVSTMSTPTRAWNAGSSEDASAAEQAEVMATEEVEAAPTPQQAPAPVQEEESGSDRIRRILARVAGVSPSLVNVKSNQDSGEVEGENRESEAVEPAADVAELGVQQEARHTPVHFAMEVRGVEMDEVAEARPEEKGVTPCGKRRVWAKDALPSYFACDDDDDDDDDDYEDGALLSLDATASTSEELGASPVPGALRRDSVSAFFGLMTGSASRPLREEEMQAEAMEMEAAAHADLDAAELEAEQEEAEEAEEAAATEEVAAAAMDVSNLSCVIDAMDATDEAVDLLYEEAEEMIAEAEVEAMLEEAKADAMEAAWEAEQEEAKAEAEKHAKSLAEALVAEAVEKAVVLVATAAEESDGVYADAKGAMAQSETNDQLFVEEGVSAHGGATGAEVAIEGGSVVMERTSPGPKPLAREPSGRRVTFACEVREAAPPACGDDDSYSVSRLSDDESEQEEEEACVPPSVVRILSDGADDATWLLDASILDLSEGMAAAEGIEEGEALEWLRRRTVVPSAGVGAASRSGGDVRRRMSTGPRRVSIAAAAMAAAAAEGEATRTTPKAARTPKASGAASGEGLVEFAQLRTPGSAADADGRRVTMGARRMMQRFSFFLRTPPPPNTSGADGEKAAEDARRVSTAFRAPQFEEDIEAWLSSSTPVKDAKPPRLTTAPSLGPINETVSPLPESTAQTAQPQPTALRAVAPTAAPKPTMRAASTQGKLTLPQTALGGGTLRSLGSGVGNKKPSTANATSGVGKAARGAGNSKRVSSVMAPSRDGPTQSQTTQEGVEMQVAARRPKAKARPSSRIAQAFGRK